MAEEPGPLRALAVAATAMLAVALLVGLAIGGVVVGVLRQTDSQAADGTRSGAAAESTLYMPRYRPTGSPEDHGLPTFEPSPTPSVDLPSGSPSTAGGAILLTASPAQVAPGQRIDLTGSYPGGDGVALQVQRREGGVWTDFPVTATVSDGTFSTWITTSRTGRTEFRVYDASADVASDPAVVRIG